MPAAALHELVLSTPDHPGASYPIVIGPGARARVSGLMASAASGGRVLVIADENVAELHWPALREQLPTATRLATFAAGEGSKSLAVVERMVDEASRAGLQRSDLIVAFGGGVAGDLAGFVAAIWMRGIRFLQVATTLEAAIDASVGGKTGVNTAGGKNLVGAFHQPSAVVIDTDFLATLSDRDYRAALAESVKHAAIRAPDFLAWHEDRFQQIVDRDPETVQSLIARNCAIKAGVVAQDEREHGLRAVLNHGHTVGHAIEALTHFELRHGECVGLGMLVENALAVRLGLLEASVAERLGLVIDRLGLPTRAPVLRKDAFLDVCARDKKNASGRTAFMLLEGLGSVRRVDDADPAMVWGAYTDFASD